MYIINENMFNYYLIFLKKRTKKNKITLDVIEDTIYQIIYKFSKKL